MMNETPHQNALERADERPDEKAAIRRSGDIAREAAALPANALILVPVRNLVLFPTVILPIAVGREQSVAAAQEAMRSERPVGIVLQRNASVDVPGADDLYRVGTQANVLRYLTAPDGSHHLVCQGTQRFRVVEFLDGYPFVAARVELYEEPEIAYGAETEARVHLLREQAKEALQLVPQAPALSFLHPS